MAGFYIWETVTIPIKLSREDALEDYEHVVVSLSQSGKEPMHFTEDELGIDVENATINLALRQDQTGAFREGGVTVQVNIYYANHERDASAKGTIQAKDNLLKRVIT